ncbi:MAG TPA: bifunctional diguanylate cyclase/phosphodiesterase [Solirubrobacteraceae bacterium]|jgi:diguanylate cyclase (GGDEF)-like protein|nr:bifunctional diguanylate cyclase/phosphodiesterase [Solirubrobacteraceae bacterium]
MSSTRPARSTGQRLSRRVRGALIGALIFALAIAASGFTASEWRSNLRRGNEHAFASTATDVSSTLDSKLDADLAQTRTLRTIATLEPSVGDTRFTQWYDELRRGAPAPIGVASALIEFVPASKLQAFLGAARSDPVFRALLARHPDIVPAGRRSVYCLTRASVGHTAATDLYPPLLDYCAPAIPGLGRSPFDALIATATDTASTIVAPIPGVSLVAIGEAVYRPGVSLASVAARRAAVTGLIGTSFNGSSLIRPLLASHRSLELALYHRNSGGRLELIGRAGNASHEYTQRTNLGEGWIAVVTGGPQASVSPDAQAAIVLGAGVLVTLLAFMLYEVLRRSRRHAWRLVGEKTVELEHSALHDPLTDLPNRLLVLDRAEQLLARAKRLDVPVIALFVDIDDLKQINDRHGHQIGDEVLRQVGARLKATLRDNDTVGRIGDDEFVMLVDSIGLDAAPTLVAERILDVLRQPIGLPADAQAPILLTASIGIASGRPESAEALLKDADLALYEAKAEGKNTYVTFESSMQTAAQDRIHLEMDLAGALDADQLYLMYQPMLDLESEGVVGVEALLRWRHPTAGVIGPDVFIPIAEQNGVIITIGQWVLEQACLQASAWRRDGYALNMSVNVSARQLERTEFVDEVRGVLRRTGMDAKALTLEITETVLMRQPDTTARLLTQLKALGIRIAVDDFGTGYSSLAYLRQFPVDSLKIDRTFITGLARSSEAHALAHTLIQLGKALGLQTLAEGVEDHDQVRELQREGCDLAQGFLFARPLAADVLERFLRESPGLAGAPTDSNEPSAAWAATAHPFP